MTGTTPGTLLGGRVVHVQPATGHRTGVEPVLLAAAVPARPGQLVLEGGSGAGAALLCLAARVPGLSGLGLESEASLVALARRNAAASGFEALRFTQADLTAWRTGETFDHAMANPPWHRAAGTASPDPGKQAAKRAPPGLLAAWAAALSRPLRHRGSLTFVVAAAVVPECLAALAQAGCGSPALLPLWPRPGHAAKLVLLRAIKGGRAEFRLLPGMALHAQAGGYAPAADAVLRGGAAIDWEG